MSKLQFTIVAALLLALVALQAYPLVVLRQAGGAWEYMIESPDDEKLLPEMNASGDAGWELVFARRAVNEGRDASYEMIFKRQR